MNDNLPELRDIHLPEGVSAWPIAYGWWVILAAIIGLIALFYLISYLRKKSKKLYALHLLKTVYGHDTLDSAVQMSQILRRICVYKYKDAATLFGKPWVEFLNTHTKGRKLDDKTAELLIEAPYIAPNTSKFSAADVINLRSFCQNWIGENL